MTDIPIMDMIKYDPSKGCFVMRSDKPTPPLSPFRWKEDPRPSIFATDPYFKSRHKAGLLDDDEGLKYKQFGTRYLSEIPLTNVHAGGLEHNPGDKLFVKRRVKERND
jgi:hypothetical protein